MRSVVAAFDQEKHLSLFGDVVRTSGMILYSRPDLLRWEIRKPFRSILIVAGNDVAKFEFRKGTRRRLTLGRSGDVILMVMSQIRSWFRGDFSSSAKSYDVNLYSDSPARITLVPKARSLRKTIRSIELRLSSDLAAVSRVTIHERAGDKTVMHFTPAGRAKPSWTKPSGAKPGRTKQPASSGTAKSKPGTNPVAQPLDGQLFDTKNPLELGKGWVKRPIVRDRAKPATSTKPTTRPKKDMGRGTEPKDARRRP